MDSRGALAAKLGMERFARNLHREVRGTVLNWHCGGRVSKRSTGNAVPLTRRCNHLGNRSTSFWLCSAANEPRTDEQKLRDFCGTIGPAKVTSGLFRSLRPLKIGCGFCSKTLVTTGLR
jgi:hypothetical protein